MFWFWYRLAAMSRRYFSVGEVDRMVPKLERIFVQVLQLRAAMRAEELKLEKAGVRLTPELLERESSRRAHPGAHRQDDVPGLLRRR